MLPPACPGKPPVAPSPPPAEQGQQPAKNRWGWSREGKQEGVEVRRGEEGGKALGTREEGNIDVGDSPECWKKC